MTDSVTPTTTASTTIKATEATEATATNEYKTKTVFLIRHAESEENHRLHCAKNIFGSLKQLSVPKMSDVTSSFGLLNTPALYDTNLSTKGKEQVICMGKVLKDDNFIMKNNIELVVHSPLIRARDTCLGMLNCSAATTTTSTKVDPIQRVIELDIIAEKAPSEWVPGMYYQFQQRMTSFEAWLNEQPESTIAVVGHSQYFKAMLSLPFAFGNADVWQVTFQQFDDNNADSTNQLTKKKKWTDIKPIYKCTDYFNVTTVSE